MSSHNTRFMRAEARPQGADRGRNTTPYLQISRTLRIRGTRANASTEHLPQNVEPSRRGDSARSAP